MKVIANSPSESPVLDIRLRLLDLLGNSLEVVDSELGAS